MTRFRTAGSLPLAVTVVLVALLLTPGTAHACSCTGETLADHADEVAVAFTGRQIERIEHPSAVANGERSDDPVTLVFEVSLVYKGTVGPRVEVLTERYGCGVDFSGMGTVGVAAFSRSPQWQAELEGDLQVGWCASRVAIAELEDVFGSGYPPDPNLVPASADPSEGSLLSTTLLVGGGGLILATIGLFAWHRTRQPR